MGDNIPGIVIVPIMIVESLITVLSGLVTVVVPVDPGKVLLPLDTVAVSVMIVVTVVPGSIVPGRVTVVFGIVTVEISVAAADVVDTGIVVTPT